MQSLLSFAWPIDLVIAIVSALVVSIIALKWGKQHILGLLIAFPIASLLYLNFPYFSKLAFGESAWQIFAVRALIFLLILVVIKILIQPHVADRSSGNRLRRYAEVGALGIISTVFAVLCLKHVVPVEELYVFSRWFVFLFAGTSAFFWWIVVSFLGLFLINK